MKLLATLIFWLSYAAAGVVHPASGVGRQAHDITSPDASVKQQNAVAQPIANVNEKGITVGFTDSTDENTTKVEEQDPADFVFNPTTAQDQKIVERVDTELEESEDVPTKSTVELHSNDPVDDYNAEHPFNRIPDWVYCYHPSEFPVTPTRHERMNILAALEAALELRDDDIWNRPRFAGIRYPHIIAWTDYFSQTITHVRRLNLGHARGDPFMFPILMGDNNIFRDGAAPGPDRIIFDEDGTYLGMMTFRGNGWWWCIPVFDPIIPDQGASARGIPGADEAAMETPLPTSLGWINAPNPWVGGSAGSPM